MTLTEIFKDRPELMEEPEVKHLIEYVKEQYVKGFELFYKTRRREMNVLEVVFQSELFVINGTPAEEALNKIAKILE
jgi:hypothetical protein